jgi:hypothetical protein
MSAILCSNDLYRGCIHAAINSAAARNHPFRDKRQAARRPAKTPKQADRVQPHRDDILSQYETHAAVQYTVPIVVEIGIGTSPRRKPPAQN